MTGPGSGTVWLRIDHEGEPRDPRKNAPARICDLPREEMLQHLYARDAGRRETYMRMYRNPMPKRSLIARVVRRFSRVAGGAS